jgi:DNA modification methylase
VATPTTPVAQLPRQARPPLTPGDRHVLTSANCRYAFYRVGFTLAITSGINALIAALGHNDVTAYLTMMAPRLLELHRVLRPNGSLYLHCDPTASHYLKLLLDSIFGPGCFTNEIVWKRTTTKSDFRQGALNWPRIHDVLLYYRRSPKAAGVFSQPFTAYTEEYTADKYRHQDPDGRRYMLDKLTAPGFGSRGHPTYEFMGVTRPWVYGKDTMQRLAAEGRVVQPSPGAVPRYKRYLDEVRGVAIGDVWDDISAINSMAKERLGYPTQKPLALLERIISASSNPGDIVLDPFCGCGTAVHAAQKLGRRWIGIDITPLATNLIRDRMQKAFPGLKVEIEGWPKDMSGARALAALQDRYHFQDWAVIEVGARPFGGERKKGADRGVDGVIPFIDGSAGPKRGIVSVKSGATKPADVQALAGVVEADSAAAFGVFICLEKPTRQMNEVALEAGTWTSANNDKTYRKIQILSAQDLLDGKTVDMPHGARTAVFAQAARETAHEGTQTTLDV